MPTFSCNAQVYQLNVIIENRRDQREHPVVHCIRIRIVAQQDAVSSYNSFVVLSYSMLQCCAIFQRVKINVVRL